MLLPPLRGLLPLHFGELLILLGQPQRHVTYISVTPHPLCFCCTPSAKHNSMSKPTRVCPFLWTALGTNMVAKRFFPPLKLNYQPYETLERDERDGRFFKMAQSVLRWEKRWGNGALLHCKYECNHHQDTKEHLKPEGHHGRTGHNISIWSVFNLKKRGHNLVFKC